MKKLLVALAVIAVSYAAFGQSNGSLVSGAKSTGVLSTPDGSRETQFYLPGSYSSSESVTQTGNGGTGLLTDEESESFTYAASQIEWTHNTYNWTAEINVKVVNLAAMASATLPPGSKSGEAGATGTMSFGHAPGQPLGIQSNTLS